MQRLKVSISILTLKTETLTSSSLLWYLVWLLIVTALHPFYARRIIGIVKANDLVRKNNGSVQIGVTSNRIQRVRFPILVQIVGCRLRQQSVYRFPFGDRVQRRCRTHGPASDRPSRVQGRKKASRATRSRRPKWLKNKF